MTDMQEIDFKTLIVDAIAGAGFPDEAFVERCVRMGVAKRGEHGQDAMWLKAMLYEAMPEDELQLLYYSIKNYSTLAPTHPRIIIPGA